LCSARQRPTLRAWRCFPSYLRVSAEDGLLMECTISPRSRRLVGREIPVARPSRSESAGRSSRSHEEMNVSTVTDWTSVVTHPLGLWGFALCRVFGVLSLSLKRRTPYWITGCLMVFAAVCLVSG